MSEEKDVEEVINEIKNDVAQIKGLLLKKDLTLTLILRNLNLLLNNNNFKVVENKSTEEIIVNSISSSNNKDYNIKTPIVKKISSKPKQVEDVEFSEYSPKEGEDLYLVRAKVLSPNGKCAFMASVSLFDANSNELLESKRLGGNGKWSFSLKKGNYKLSIKKQETSKGSGIDMEFYFDVVGNINPIDLGIINGGNVKKTW